ncbi:MAG: threonylcarbamoyl-AMP synthase [Elusimicrobia bacterium]|nr:threonylcarbamoyl-AMP synthase [Elusimicrobiota bacterium]
MPPASVVSWKPGDPAPASFPAIAAAVKRGKLVVFPTDTVYGIGTSALIPGACERIFAAKGRDPAKPLPILVHSTEEARRWVVFTPAAERLAAAFWPGPLTMVLEPTKAGEKLTTIGATTLAIRVPNHDVLLALLQASGVPWAATSANLSGRPAAKDGAAAAAALGEKAEWVVDAGPADGTESTVVDARALPLSILREGALSKARLEAALA